MFDLGWGEFWIAAGIAMALTLLWHGWRGRWVGVSREWVIDLDPDRVEDVLVRAFASGGNQWRAQPDGSWIFTDRRVPLWAALLCVVTLPLGLILLLIKETADLHIKVVAEPGGCRVRAVGRTPSATFQAMDTWLRRVERKERALS